MLSGSCVAYHMQYIYIWTMKLLNGYNIGAEREQARNDRGHSIWHSLYHQSLCMYIAFSDTIVWWYPNAYEETHHYMQISSVDSEFSTNQTTGFTNEPRLYCMAPKEYWIWNRKVSRGLLYFLTHKQVLTFFWKCNFMFVCYFEYAWSRCKKLQLLFIQYCGYCCPAVL